MVWVIRNSALKNITSLEIERRYWKEGRTVAGLDEAGRGSLAGPVVAASVIFPIGFEPSFRVNDSKKLTPRKRLEIYEKIIANCISYSIAFVEPETIDKINILNSTILAMNKSCVEYKALNPILLVDGNRFFSESFHFRTIVDGDEICFSIASASIIAKVERDKWMQTVAHSLYPQYGFDKHKGYGTKQHIQRILEYGICPLHRKTFVQKILNREELLF